MPSRAYHEAIWASVPAGCEPIDYPLRTRFLLAHVAAGERVLDVGCGEGAFAAALIDAGASVIGIDVAEEPLRRARALHPALELRRVDGEGAWPLEDSSFDAVWAGEVIEHVADTAAWLSEVGRVLRPGGRMLLSTPAHGAFTRLRLALSRAAFAERFDPLSDHLRFYTAGTLAGVLEDFGFEHVRVRAAGGLPGARRLLLASALRMSRAQ
jgi:2-polyprenyl-6-hydroxyphenyl methylase/3-demethylubiquinone-9 3-methyltransferase